MTEPESKSLTRDPARGMIGGVCAGLADYAGIDATLLRVIYVVGAIVSAAFPGLLIYILLWIVMPQRRGPR